MSAVPAVSAGTRICRTCGREYPLTKDYFHPCKGALGSGHRRKCIRCYREENAGRARDQRKELRAIKDAKPKTKWKPRVVGQFGPEGGYTEYPIEGFRWIYLPDIHGRLVDREAFGAALALGSWYRPEMVIVGGDLLDLEAISKYESPAEAQFYISEDIQAAADCMKQIRAVFPDSQIKVLSGNHDRRWERYMHRHPAMANALKIKNVDIPFMLDFGEIGATWIPEGFLIAHEKFMWKHGNAVRAKSAASAAAELDRNGISGASGHTHRLGLHFKRTKAGTSVWCESGCLCGLDPPYAEGQTMDWQQGVSIGSVSLTGHGFTVHPIPIVKGRARILGMDIGA